MNYNDVISLCNGNIDKISLLKTKQEKEISKNDNYCNVVKKIFFVLFLIVCLICTIFIDRIFLVITHDVGYVHNSSPEDIVYITNTGNCYHSIGCGSLYSSRIPIDIRVAVSRGFRECERCRPGREYSISFTDYFMFSKYTYVALIISCFMIFIIYGSVSEIVSTRYRKKEITIRAFYKEKISVILMDFDTIIGSLDFKTLCSVPVDVDVDQNLLPLDNSYFSYISQSGRCYHSISQCKGYIRKHSFLCTEYEKCSLCGKDIYIPDWYNRYKDLMKLINQVKTNHIV